MEIVLLVLFIIAILASLISCVSDSILTHYKKKYNKLLEEQNQLLLENIKIYHEILIQITKKSEEKVNEQSNH